MLKQRIISAIAAIVVLAVAVYFLPVSELRWIVLAIWTLGAWEWSGFIKDISKAKRLAYTVLLFIPLVIIALGHLPAFALLWVLVSGIIFWIFSFVQILRYPQVFSIPIIGLSGIFLILPSYTAFDYLLRSEQGLMYVLLLLLMIWAADVGAYFSGKSIGKYKLAPKVSPGKTREGAVGGLLLSLLIAVSGAKYLLELTWAQSFKHFLLLGFIIVFSSIVGDLTVSMFKRNAGVKDSGVFLPGHGGVMDRVDSLCAGVVFFAAWVFLFNPSSLLA